MPCHEPKARSRVEAHPLVRACRRSTGENYSLCFSPAHKWFFFPRMAKDEALLFKVFDNKEDGPRFVFHTAFDDPDTPADAPPRRSIEIRAIAFFDDPLGEA